MVDCVYSLSLRSMVHRVHVGSGEGMAASPSILFLTVVPFASSELAQP